MLGRLHLFICILLSVFTNVAAQDDRWKQLVPLVSTRAEVEQVLGKPVDYFKTYGIYGKSPNPVISAWYSTGKCSGTEDGSSSYKVRAGLMTRLYITFGNERTLEAMDADFSKFRRRQFKELGDNVYYYSPDESIVYKMSVEKDGREIVRSVSLQPGINTEALRCRALVRSRSREVNHHLERDSTAHPEETSNANYAYAQ